MNNAETAVTFRRLKGSREYLDPADRYETLGETIMGAVPAPGELVWLNGVAYKVEAREWSLVLSSPDFGLHEVMITVTAVYNEVNLQDFRQ